MARGELSPDVERLLRKHIGSIEQLEILLLLARNPGSEWDARAVHEQLRTNETSASARLADLVARGLAEARQDEGRTLYRFSPADEELRAAVAALDVAYAERRYTVIDVIFQKPMDTLRIFAGAFRFRKDEEDG